MHMMGFQMACKFAHVTQHHNYQIPYTTVIVLKLSLFFMFDLSVVLQLQSELQSAATAD